MGFLWLPYPLDAPTGATTMTKPFYYPHIDNETVVLLCEFYRAHNKPHGALRGSIDRVQYMFTNWTKEEIAEASKRPGIEVKHAK